MMQQKHSLNFGKKEKSAKLFDGEIANTEVVQKNQKEITKLKIQKI
jgi:hypothetical protein